MAYFSLSRIGNTSLFLCVLIARAASSEPIVLSDPQVSAGPSFESISIGGSAVGFLLAGSGSHKPIAVPLGLEATPLIVGSTALGTRSADSVGEPVLADGRWIVPISPDFLSPDQLLLAEVGVDGSPLRDPLRVPWRRMAHAEIAVGREKVAIVATTDEGVFRYSLRVRIASLDLSNISDETALAVDLRFSGAFVRTFRVIATDEGFLVAYSHESGLSVVRLSADGTRIGSPLVVTATSGEPFDLIAAPGGGVAIWTEGPPSVRTLRAAKISTEVIALGPLGTVDGTERPVLFLRPIGSDIMAIWQGVDYIDGQRQGRDVTRRTLNSNGVPISDSDVVAGFENRDLLVAAASRGDAVLLAMDRHLVGVGRSLWGSLVTRSHATSPQPLKLSYRTPKSLTVTSANDGVAVAAWVEFSTVGETLMLGFWDRHRTRISARAVRAIRGVFGGIDVAAGGGQVLLVWHEGAAVYGAYVGVAALQSDPFVIAGPDSVSSASWPRAVWDGRRFLVTWKSGSDISAAFVVGLGTQQLGVISAAPRLGGGSAFYFDSPRIAAGSNGALIVSHLLEMLPCVGIPCSRSHMATIRLDENGRASPMEVESSLIDPTPDVSSDGKDFLIVYSTESGIRTRLSTFTANVPPVDRVLSASSGSAAAAVAWNGSEYIAAWASGGFIHSAALDRRGELKDPVRRLETAGIAVDVAGLPADALLVWLGRLSGSGPLTPMGELFLRAEVPEVPSRRRAVRR